MATGLEDLGPIMQLYGMFGPEAKAKQAESAARASLTTAQAGAIPSEIQDRLARMGAIPSEIALRTAQAGNLGATTEEMRAKLPFVGQQAEAGVANTRADTASKAAGTAQTTAQTAELPATAASNRGLQAAQTDESRGRIKQQDAALDQSGLGLAGSLAKDLYGVDPTGKLSMGILKEVGGPRMQKAMAGTPQALAERVQSGQGTPEDIAKFKATSPAAYLMWQKTQDQKPKASRVITPQNESTAYGIGQGMKAVASPIVDIFKEIYNLGGQLPAEVLAGLLGTSNPLPKVNTMFREQPKQEQLPIPEGL
jgi:hypothetical protein